MRRLPLPLLLALGCSSPATSRDRPQDAGADVADVPAAQDVRDVVAADVTDATTTVDATDATTTADVTDATTTVDATDATTTVDATDATTTADVTDATTTVDATDATAARDVAPPTDAPPVTPGIVQLTGRFLTTAMQARLDALYATLGVNPPRVSPDTVTADALRQRVIVAAFAAAPADWSDRATMLTDAVRGGAWMLAEVYGAWPLREAGALSAVELPWSRTSPCVGTFFWIRPDTGEEGHPLFAGMPLWSPTPSTLDQGLTFAGYSTNTVGMTVPVFNAQSPNARTRHRYVQYVASHCEPGTSAHPWCAENPTRCDASGGLGANDGWVDEFTVGAGRVIVVQTGTHQTGGWQWGEATTRLQANAIRYAQQRISAR